MARLIAFAMQLPSLSEEQESRIRRYGQEYCDEIRLVKGESTTVVAGLLMNPFKSKKVAQTAFGVNFKAWKITKLPNVRAWYRELSMDEYFTEFKGVPRILGREMQGMLARALYKSVCCGAYKAHIRETREIVKAHKEATAKIVGVQRLAWILARIVKQRTRDCYDHLTDPIKQRHREQDMMRVEDRCSRRAAEGRVIWEKQKAQLEHENLLRTSLQYREKFNYEKIKRERAEQASHVDFFNRKRKAEQQWADEPNLV
jgi:hypothetical protein